MGQLESIHRPRHLDAGKYQVDVAPTLKDRNGLIGIACVDDIETGRLDCVDSVHSDQSFVFDNEHDGGKPALRHRLVFRVRAACAAGRKAAFGADAQQPK